jgi:hypothetical protein
MSLSPEQFDKLTTNDELKEVHDDIKDIKIGVSELLTGIDGLTKKLATSNTLSSPISLPTTVLKNA